MLAPLPLVPTSPLLVASYYKIGVNDECVALIDTRGEARREARRIINAVTINAECIADRWQELPPRCTRYALLVDASSACTAMVDTILASAGMRTDLCAVISETDCAFWDRVPAYLIVSGTGDASASLGAAPVLRLWRPGMLAALLVKQWRAWRLPTSTDTAPNATDDTAPKGHSHSHSRSHRRDRAALLDVGCGQGRNTIFILGESVAAAGVPIDIVAIDKRPHLALRTARFAVSTTDAHVVLDGQVISSGSGGSPNNLTLTAKGGSSDNHCALFAVSCLATDYIAAAQHRLFQGVIAQGTENDFEAAPDSFDVIFFARNTLKDVIVQSLPLLAARAALRSGGAIIAVESYHMAAAHPVRCAQKLAEGELSALITAAVDVRMWSVETVHESRALSEDDRPMLLSVVRVSLRVGVVYY